MNDAKLQTEYVGKFLTEEVEKQISRQFSGQKVRYISRGGLLTADYVQGRVNVYLNEKNQIESVFIE